MVSELWNWVLTSILGLRICSVECDGYDVDFIVGANVTHKELMRVLGQRLKLQTEEYALVVRDGRMYARPRDHLKASSFSLVKRDVVGGNGDPPPLRLEPWDSKTYRRVVDHLEACTTEGNERLRLFLSWIYYDTPLGESLLEAVHSVKRCTLDEVRVKWFPTESTSSFTAAKENSFKWLAIKCELKKLIPQESTLAPLEHLKRMTKKPSENLLEFVTRYCRTWKYYNDEGKITEKNATHVLLQKLPADFIYHLSTIPFADVTLQKIYERASSVMHYLRLRSKEITAKAKLDDYIDVDSARLMSGEVIEDTEVSCAAVRDTLLKNGKLNFPMTLNSKNQVMVAYKELIKEDRFFQESQRAIRSEEERRKQRKEAARTMCTDDKQDETSHLCQVESEEENSDDPMEPLVCRSLQKRKASMHAKVCINGKAISALVDTGATDNFIQEATVQALGLSSDVRPSRRYVTLANGAQEKITGYVQLKATIGWQELDMDAYCFRGKGEAMILGFSFLMEHGVMIDCGNKKLLAKDAPEVQCYKILDAETKNEIAPSVTPAHPRA